MGGQIHCENIYDFVKSSSSLIGTFVLHMCKSISLNRTSVFDTAGQTHMCKSIFRVPSIHVPLTLENI
jgi:hypothetical protein